MTLRALFRFISLFFSIFLTIDTIHAIGGGKAAKENDDTSFEAFNFTFDNPGWPWVSIDAASLSEDAKVGYRKTINDAYFIIIPEAVGVEYGFTSQNLVESAKTNMRTITQNAEFSEASTVEINGVKWINFTAKISLMGESLVYGYLVHAGNGYGYQLITWRSGEFPELAKSDILELGEKFNFIDPDRVINSDEFRPLSLFKDEPAGFEIDLTGKGWTTWPFGEAEYPAATLAATQLNEVFFFVVPLYHDGLNPSYKDLKAGFLAQMFDLDVSSGFNSKDKILRDGTTRSLQSTFSFESLTGDINHFVIQIRKFQGFSYILGGYSLDPSKLDKVEALLAEAKINDAIDIESISQSLSPEVNFFQSQSLNHLAINAYSQNNYVQAKRYLERALAFDNSDPAIASNFAAVASDQGDYQSIINLYQSDPESYLENTAFSEYYALALFRSNQNEEAEKVFLQILDTGNMSESGLYAYMEMLALQERWEDGAGIADEFYELTGSQVSRQWSASFYMEVGEFEKALGMLAALKEEMPFELSLDYDIANIYLREEKYAKALEYLAGIGEEIDSYPMLYTLKGNAHFSLKSYEKAQESYRTSLELNPLDEEAQAMLEYATLALGKGDTDVSTIPIDPVPIPASLLEKAKLAEAKAAETKESEILYTFLSIRYENEKLSKQTRTTKVAIRDDAGLDAYSTLAFSFDPFFEEVFVNEIIVRDASGEVVGREVRDDFYILDENSSEVVSQDRALYAPVSGLSKNCTVEYSITYNTTGLIDGFPLTWESFTYYQPSRLCGLSVSGDTDSISYFVSDGVAPVDSDSSLVWIAEDVPSYKTESFQADLETFAPHLVLAEKSKNWKSEVDEYREEIVDRLQTSEAISTLASSLVKDAKSESERISAIYQYIQKEFTYKALSFGPRAQIPNTADQIVSDKYGDCKDLALLANRLLDAAGVRSYLALVNTGAHIKTDLPSLDQFDHMILYLPDHNEGHFIDCTSQHVPLELSTPLGLDEREILVLDWEDPHFLSSKAQVLDENTIKSNRRIELVEEELRVEETLQFTGLPAAYFRSYLSTVQESQLLDMFQSLMASGTSQNLRLENVEAMDAEDVSKPLRVVMSYNIPRAIKKSSIGFTVSALPSVWEHYYLEVPFVWDRKTPFDIRAPLKFDTTMTMTIPKGAKLSEQAIVNVEKDTGFHSYQHHRQADPSKRQVTLSNSIVLISQEGPPHRFDSFQNSAHDALALVGDSLEFVFVQKSSTPAN